MEKVLKIFLISVIIMMSSRYASAFGSPDFVPNGPHPRIWMTSSLISALQAKRAANTADWQNILDRDAVYSSYTSNQPYRLDWPGGAGYAGSGYQDAIMTWGLLYYTYKTPAYGTSSETADDVTARSYATKAVNLINAIIGYYSSGSEQDGIDLVRMNDHLYMFNIDEEAINAALNGNVNAALNYRGGQTNLLTYKNGYAARTAASVLPIFYDWFYNDPLFTSSLKTTLYKIMYRHIDWFRGVRSTYNNGILINGVRYHEDTNGACTGTNSDGTTNDCNISDTSDAYAQKGYSFGFDGANFYESFVGMTMMDAVAVYGDPPQTDADSYLAYAQSLLADHLTTMASPTQWLGGDSTEGVFYNSSWNSTLMGMLAMETATGQDVFTGFRFPQDMALNAIYNTYPNLTNVVNRGAWSSGSRNQWMTVQPEPVLPASLILRNYYGNPVEAQYFQQWLNTTTTYNNGQAWEQFLWRNDLTATHADFSVLPLYNQATGTGVVTLKSSWANASDTITAQIVLTGNQRTDHQGFNNGQITLTRGNDNLLSRIRESGGENEKSVGQNTIVFNNADCFDSPLANSNYWPAPLLKPAIDRIEHESGYDFVSAEISNAWKVNKTLYPEGIDLAEYFRRSVVYLRPSIMVVYDVTESNTTSGNAKAWYTQFEAAPTITGNLITASIGSSKVFVDTLYPTGGTYTSTNLSTSSVIAPVFYSVSYAPAVMQQYDQFLNVIEATSSSGSQTSTTAISASNMRGVQVGTNIVMFGTDQGGAYPSGTITYNYTGSSTSTHYLILSPGSGYDVTASGSSPRTLTLVPDSGSAIMTSSNGILVLSVNDSTNAVAQINCISTSTNSIRLGKSGIRAGKLPPGQQGIRVR